MMTQWQTMTRIIRNLFFCLLVIFFWAPIGSHGVLPAHGESTDKEIMALYLYNFLLFVDWPENEHGQPSTLQVNIYADPLLYKALTALSGNLIKGKTVHVRSLETLKDLDMSCQVLFVGNTKRTDIPAILEKTHNRCILTLSDAQDFTRKGGMVYFKNPADIGKKKFEINMSVVERSCLKIRSRLLRISDIVYDNKFLSTDKP